MNSICIVCMEQKDNHKKNKLRIPIIVALVFILAILLVALFYGMSKKNIKITIKIGTYVQLGKYYNEPILWRCVDIDEKGTLMLADKILTIKPFDASGNHKYLDGITQADTFNYRTDYGSNLWETSNMRSWLNSTAKAGNVIWLDGCPPTEDKVNKGYNVYANEKGFLAEGNLTESEKNAIKSVTQKSLLADIDVSKLKEGGTSIHFYDYDISTAVQNYDTAYYQNVTDKIFLLYIKQLDKVYQNSSILGSDYYRGKPTQKAVDNSDYRDNELSVDKYWYNYTRTPYVDSSEPYGVRYLLSGGNVIYHSTVNRYVLGARPAFYINLPSKIFKSGNGTINQPYVE